MNEQQLEQAIETITENPTTTTIVDKTGNTVELIKRRNHPIAKCLSDDRPERKQGEAVPENSVTKKKRPSRNYFASGTLCLIVITTMLTIAKTFPCNRVFVILILFITNCTNN